MLPYGDVAFAGCGPCLSRNRGGDDYECQYIACAYHLSEAAFGKRRGPECDGRRHSFGSRPYIGGGYFVGSLLAVAFAINVPVGIITFYLGRKYLPANPTRVLGRRFKWKEALFNALTFGLLIGCIEAYSHDVSHTTILAGAVCLLFVGVQYVRMQLHDKYPMLPFDLLKIPAFSLSVVTSVLSFTSQMLAMVAMPFYWSIHFIMRQ